MSKPQKAKKEAVEKGKTNGKSEEVERLEEQLKKALADYQNLKKSMEKRLEFEGTLVKAEMLKQVIEIADDIDVAMDHAEDEKGWRDGVTHILEKFRKVIENMDAEIIGCEVGDKFDAEVHEAVGVMASEDKEKDGHIAQVVQNGYKMGDIIIRPVRVIVNKISK